MNIYEIDQAILALVDEETGEIMDFDAFDQLQMERDQKLENVACWHKNLVAEAAAIRQEELNLAKRRQAIENRAERLKKYLSDVLAGQKFQTAKCAVSFRKATKVELSEPALAIAWAQANGYGNIVTYKAPEISKSGLAVLLKEGKEIPGAELVTGFSVGVK